MLDAMVCFAKQGGLVMSDTLRDRFQREMVIRGLSERTQKSYGLNVELLVRRTGKHPTQLTTEDLRDYFANMIREHKVAPSTYRQNLTACCLFYKTVLGRKEQFFVDASPQKRKKLPVVLTVEETRKMLKALQVPRIQAAAIVGYSCGLRSSEIVALSVDWITAGVGSLHIHNPKGGVDRVVPLPERTLAVLRDYWRWQRPSGQLLFESPRGHGRALSGEAIRKAIKDAAHSVGINRPVCLHTLRHCYASHLLERGVALPLIQRWLGHKSINTTMIYAQLTPESIQRGRSVLAELMEFL